MLREAKEDLPDVIYIRFRTDGSLFNLRHLLARTKTTGKLITELLFADDCAFLAPTEEALQHIVNRFSDAAKNFGLTISLKNLRCCTNPLYVWHTVLLTSTSMEPTLMQCSTLPTWIA